MAEGLPDVVDCARLAENAVVLQRVYELAALPRLKDVLAEPQEAVRADFSFVKLAAGRPGAKVTIDAAPKLVCQRCMQAFALPVRGGSDIEFSGSDEPGTSKSEREFYVMENGRVSLKDLAEDELLLALPIAPACSTPLTCGKAPSYETGADASVAVGDVRRPFSGLQDLLKKT
jgi:uncharacterized protein